MTQFSRVAKSVVGRRRVFQGVLRATKNESSEKVVLWRHNSSLTSHKYREKRGEEEEEDSPFVLPSVVGSTNGVASSAESKEGKERNGLCENLLQF